MADQDLYSGLIRLHVLFHAAEEEIFGLGMIRELRRHGYRNGPGTVYPILHRLEEKGYLLSKSRLIGGKVRRAYTITKQGKGALEQAYAKVRELYEELIEHRNVPKRIGYPDGSTKHDGRSRSRGKL